MKKFIEAIHLNKSYGDVLALKDAHFCLDEGAQYAIQGTSGSGKSTLLYILAGMEYPTSGKLKVLDKVISSYNDDKLSVYRNKFIGLVFQFHFLLPSMSCFDNICMPAKIGGCFDKELIDRVRKFSKELRVEHLLKKYPNQISGGEQQRVNIIRACSLRPKLILCDEPTGSLDSNNSQNVISILKELAQENLSTLVIVTHDHSIARQMTFQFLMKDGIIKHL